MIDANFELETGIRYECGVAYNHTAGSVLECAAQCTSEKSCYGFNFGSGQCELLSAVISARTNAPGWTHGYYPAGKYQTTHREIPLS